MPTNLKQKCFLSLIKIKNKKNIYIKYYKDTRKILSACTANKFCIFHKIPVLITWNVWLNFEFKD